MQTRTWISTVVALLIVFSVHANSAEMSADQIKEFIRDSQKLLDAKKVQRVAIERRKKDHPLKVREWSMYTPKWKSFPNSLPVMVLLDSGIQTVYAAASEIPKMAGKNSIPTESLVCCLVIERPDDPGKSLLVFADKAYFTIHMMNNGVSQGWNVRMEDAPVKMKPAVFVRYGEKGVVELLIADEMAVSTMHEGATNLATVAIDLQNNKLVTSFKIHKEPKLLTPPITSYDKIPAHWEEW